MKKKIIAVDIDETICTNSFPIKNILDYENARPKKDIISLVNKLYENNHIILYTARGKLITNKKPNLKRKLRKLTINQLVTWNVKYHELNMNKIFFDIIIDDKSVNPQTKLEVLKKKLIK